MFFIIKSFVFANNLYYTHTCDYIYDLYKVRAKSKNTWYLYKQ